MENIFSFIFFFVMLNFACVIGVNHNDDMIKNLPGKPKNMSLTHFSGRVIVDNDNTKSLFYWLIEATESPTSKPLLLWLNGGPGCSSLAGGVFQEVGPFRVQGDGITLSPNPYPWTNEANILFLESPAGVGFSLLQKPQSQGDNTTAEDAYNFLLKWLLRFPQYKSRDFYIAGESYSGHYIPQLAEVLLRRKGPFINFKGILMGNPILDNYHDYAGLFEYWWGHGLISEASYNLLKQHCSNEPFMRPNSKCQATIDAAKAEFGRINNYNIFIDPCEIDDLVEKDKKKRLFGGSEFCLARNTHKYLNNLEVQKSIHADSSGRLHSWSPCSAVVYNRWTDSPRSVLPLFKKLISAKLRIWVVSGDSDAEVPLTSTRNSLKALNLSILQQWYPWNFQKEQHGGWAQRYEGLTYVTIRGAGHQVPLTHPQQALFLLKKFLRNETMPYSQLKRPPSS